MCLVISNFFSLGKAFINLSLINLSKFFYHIGFISPDFNYLLNLYKFFKRKVNKDIIENKDF